MDIVHLLLGLDLNISYDFFLFNGIEGRFERWMVVIVVAVVVVIVDSIWLK